jgi:hypothetical protein
MIGFEVLTAVVMKSSSFWDITPCSPLKVSRRFGGKHRLYLQDRRIKQAKTSVKVVANAGFLLGVFFDSEDGGDMFHRNVG